MSTRRYHMIITSDDDSKFVANQGHIISEDSWEIYYTNLEYIQRYENAIFEYSRYELGMEFPFHDSDYDEDAKIDLDEKVSYLYRHFKRITEDMLLEGTNLKYDEIKRIVDKNWREKEKEK